MTRKKICLLGASGVGKTSLAARFMDRPFSENYLTTIGVRVNRKILEVHGREVLLLIWDLAGEDRFQRVQPAYLRGSSGYLLVVDGTRGRTLDQALSLHEWARGEVGPVPFSLLLNKSDLESEWTLDLHTLGRLESEGWRIVRTSALNGVGVDFALRTLSMDIFAR